MSRASPSCPSPPSAIPKGTHPRQHPRGGEAAGRSGRSISSTTARWSADVALDPALRAHLYPFCRLTGPANVLVMPGLHAAHILTKAVPRLTSGTTIGPLLMGLSQPVQIVPMDASVNQLLDMACLAAHAARYARVAPWRAQPTLHHRL